MEISKEIKQQIDSICLRYPKKRQQSAVMAALTLVQKANGNSLTPESITAVADYLRLSRISVQEVATFYENYNHQPMGKYVIRFCHNISCMLNGADELIAYLEQKLGVKSGETTTDGRFSLKKVECLGACKDAPMFQIDEHYYKNLDEQKIDHILANLP